MLKYLAFLSTVLICFEISNAEEDNQNSFQRETTFLNSNDENDNTVIIGEEKDGDGGEINFLALGDWGGSPFFGSLPDQVLTAKGMGKVAQEINADFVVTLGDNFYFTGVEDVDSKRFVETYESVYNAKSLITIPWYVIGGNHDHYGNIDAQIQFSSSPRNTNQRWKFPSLYYSQSFTTTSSNNRGVTIDLIMIDTVDLCSKNDILDEEDERYFEPLPFLPKSYAGDQWEWIETQMSKSKADYLLVAGHYPVFSVCRHGPTETLIQHLRPLLLKYGAHYLSGHDHCANHFVEQSNHSILYGLDSSEILQSEEVNYILTGTGIECCYAATNLKNSLIPESVKLKWAMTEEKNTGHLFWKKVKGGFASFSTTKDTMKVRHHDQNGNVLFEAKPILPRSSK